MEQSETFLNELRTHTHKKIQKNWTSKQVLEFSESFNGLDFIKNKDAFYNYILDLVDDSLKLKFGLAGASVRSVGKDSIRRFLDFEYTEGFSDKVKDAFSVFNGYDDYTSFCLQIVESRKLSKKRSLFYPIAAVFITIALSWILYFFYFRKIESTYFEILNGDKIDIEEPLQVKYDFGGLNYVKAMFEIQGQVEIPQSRKGTSKIVLRSPGYKVVNLRVDDKVVSTKKIFVSTKEWWGSINQTSPLKDVSYIHDGVLQLPEKSYDTQIKETYGDFQMHKNFGISADSLIFETRVKNPKKKGFYAYDISINLNGVNSLFTFNLLDPNARIYNNMVIGKTLFETSDQRALLEPFGLNLDEWVDVTLKMENSVCYIFLNNKKVFEKTYSGNLGDFIGIQFYLKGHGSVDFVKVKDLNGKLIYEDNFLRK